MGFINLIYLLIPIISLVFVSLYIRLLLERFGQRWVTTLSHSSTLIYLPFFTFIITKVISGNIALSLGMVGALSIVRFRNPVRSPLELTVYFAAITLGIAAAVNIRWILIIFLSLNLITLILVLVSKISSKFYNKNFFTYSFVEGNPLSTLEIKTTKSISYLDDSDLVKSINISKEYKSYLLVSNDFNLLKEFSLTLENNPSLISYELNK